LPVQGSLLVFLGQHSCFLPEKHSPLQLLIEFYFIYLIANISSLFDFYIRMWPKISKGPTGNMNKKNSKYWLNNDFCGVNT